MNNIAEYVLCRDNIFYFMEKYLKLEFRGFQIDILARYESSDRPTILNIVGHRCCGLSTMNYVYLLWRALFHPNEKLALIVHNSDRIREAHQNIMRLYTTLTSTWPEQSIRYKVNITSMGRIIFDNDSMIKIVPNLADRVRGWSFNTMILDGSIRESAQFVNDCLYNTKKLIITNSEVPDDPFFDDIGDVFKYPWYCNEKRSLEWYIETLNSLGKQQFNRSYCCTRGISNDQ